MAHAHAVVAALKRVEPASGEELRRKAALTIAGRKVRVLEEPAALRVAVDYEREMVRLDTSTEGGRVVSVLVDPDEAVRKGDELILAATVVRKIVVQREVRS